MPCARKSPTVEGELGGWVVWSGVRCAQAWRPHKCQSRQCHVAVGTRKGHVSSQEVGLAMAASTSRSSTARRAGLHGRRGGGKRDSWWVAGADQSECIRSLPITCLFLPSGWLSRGDPVCVERSRGGCKGGGAAGAASASDPTAPPPRLWCQSEELPSTLQQVHAVSGRAGAPVDSTRRPAASANPSHVRCVFRPIRCYEAFQPAAACDTCAGWLRKCRSVTSATEQGLASRTARIRALSMWCGE